MTLLPDRHGLAGQADIAAIEMGAGVPVDVVPSAPCVHLVTSRGDA
jgi:hypothetical protein